MQRGSAISVVVALCVSSCLVSIGDVDPATSPDGGAGSSATGGSAGAGASAGASPSAGASGATPDAAEAGWPDAPGDDAASRCSLTYQDDFEDGVAAPFWEVVGAGAATVVEKAGLLSVQFPPVIDKSFFAGYRLARAMDLSACTALVRVDTVPPDDEDVGAAFGVFFNATDYAEFIKTGDRVHFQYFVDDAQTYLGNESYDASHHRWWRFRHDGSVLHWETSGDGKLWIVNTSAPLSPNLTSLRLGGAAFQDESDVTGSVAFDDFNLLP